MEINRSLRARLAVAAFQVIPHLQLIIGRDRITRLSALVMRIVLRP